MKRAIAAAVLALASLRTGPAEAEVGRVLVFSRTTGFRHPSIVDGVAALRLLGAHVASHPTIQPASIHVADPAHASTRTLPAPWSRTEEWYDFRSNPRGRVHVLLALDEGTYSGGRMGGDHPIAWCQFYDGGRAWYTALGHTEASYSEPLFLQHLLGGIRFAAGFPEEDCPRPRELPPRPAPR